MPDALSIVQSAYAAFGRGEVPAFLAMLTDDVHWQFVGDRAAPYTGTLSGRGQVGEWLAAIAQAEDMLAFEPRQFLAGADHVTVLGHERCSTKPAGKLFETEWVHVFRVREGRISSFWGMFDTQAAAAAR